LLRPERTTDLLGRLLAHVGLKQHLQQQFAGFASRTHLLIGYRLSAIGDQRLGWFDPNM
jgi:hypothetical protein